MHGPLISPRDGGHQVRVRRFRTIDQLLTPPGQLLTPPAPDRSGAGAFPGPGLLPA
ncbi:hypothetical protein ACFV9P_24370 [Streptomyces sp. NPDC059892]|uniref:hypothetical protein n=1 Tax=unclassified Streptomyces TaxID=2593676 RepID=UPI00365B7167